MHFIIFFDLYISIDIMFNIYIKYVFKISVNKPPYSYSYSM